VAGDASRDEPERIDPPGLGLTPEELLTTTRAVRKRLDLERPVERGLVEQCLRLAFQAPTGANAQNWAWVLVDDPAMRAEMGDIHRRAHAEVVVGDFPEDQVSARTWESSEYLNRNIHRAPILLVPTVDRRFGTTTTLEQASTWGSILPAVWSFMLALRSRGLGSSWTTVHLHREEQMAELLGIPFPEQVQVGMFPIAYTIGTTFKPADRSSSESRIFWNGWERRPTLHPTPLGL
jgi:nitroreductase